MQTSNDIQQKRVQRQERKIRYGFTTVDETTKFYLNEEGKPVICFAKYEIAPGFMWDQKFVIE